MELQYGTLTIILGAVGLLLSYVLPLLKSQLEGSKWERLINIVSVVVSAIEQLSLKEQSSSDTKLNAALGEIKKELKRQNLKFDDKFIVEVIESAVLKMNLQKPKF